MNKKMIVYIAAILMLFMHLGKAGETGESPPELQSYIDWTQKVVEMVRNAQGFVELRASRNILGSPQIKVTTVWTSMSAWAKFVQSDMWQKALRELSYEYATNIDISVWTISPLLEQIIGPPEEETDPGTHPPEEETEPGTRPPEEEIRTITHPPEYPVYKSYVEVDLTYDLLPHH
jgi:heme-degrading monooxygenase HmoA